LKYTNSEEVITHTFSRHAEGRNGADWEWWFLNDTGRSIGFRVQAKTIDIGTERYEHLHYRSWGRYQCDKLIERASGGIRPLIPIYCFYTHTHNEDLLSDWSCCLEDEDKSLFGCSIASAYIVQTWQEGHLRALSDIHEYLRPWHCLVCCASHGGHSFPDRIERYVRNTHFFPETKNESAINFPESFVSNSLPDYIQNIKSGNLGNIKAPDKYLGGVLIITEKERK